MYKHMPHQLQHMFALSMTVLSAHSNATLYNNNEMLLLPLLLLPCYCYCCCCCGTTVLLAY